MGADWLLIIVLGIALILAGWQWMEGILFPLHRRIRRRSQAPGATVLVPLHGVTRFTETCLESWLVQNYPGPLQFLFLVEDRRDPACAVAEKVLQKYPSLQAELVICEKAVGANRKVAKLAAAAPRIRHDYVIVSDADVRVPPDLLANLVPALSESGVGLACCLYRLAHAHGMAMQCEAVAINADFWTNVLQARRLGGLRFALGAVMALRRDVLERIGGFESIRDLLADDYWLGRKAFEIGERVEICPIVVNLCHDQEGWRQVWSRQVRWARTIRVCQPIGYFASILNNITFWTLLWLAVTHHPYRWIIAGGCLAARLAMAMDNQRRLLQGWRHIRWFWMPWVKDLVQVVWWALAFTGRTVRWGDRRYRIGKGGRLIELPNGSKVQER